MQGVRRLVVGLSPMTLIFLRIIQIQSISRSVDGLGNKQKAVAHANAAPVTEPYES